MIELNKIYCENCLDTLRRMPDNFIDNCITSPPYYGLRDYGTAKWEGGNVNCDHKGKPLATRANVNNNYGAGFKDGKNADYFEPFKDICGKCGAIRIDEQIGLEETPEQYVEKLVVVFREVRRAMKNDGTLWLNLGDSYWGSGKGSGHDEFTKNLGRNTADYGGQIKNFAMGKHPKFKPKDLIGIPWMVACALRSDGWYLRQDIIWHKPNPMPESVTDRCTKAHEYVFLLTKSAKYYYDYEAIKQPVTDSTVFRMAQQIEKQKGSERVPGKTNGNMKAVGPGRNVRKGVDIKGGNQGSLIGIPAMAINGNGVNGHSGYFDAEGNLIGNGYANKRSVWAVTTKPFSEAHFAVYPEDLIEPCVLTTKKDAVIYDPFGGSGTTGVVALRAGRKFIMSELNPEYVRIAERRLYPHLHNLFT